MFDNTGNGIHVVDTTTRVISGSNTTIDTNGGYGVAADSSTANVFINSTMFSNTSGYFNSNVNNNVNFDGAPVPSTCTHTNYMPVMISGVPRKVMLYG